MGQLNPSSIRVDPMPWTIDLIYSLWKSGRLQHLHTWGEATPCNHLWRVEGLLLALPPKPIVLLEYVGEDGLYDTVIDGPSRHDVAVVLEYINGGFALEGMQYVAQFNGCFYKDLPRHLQRRILEREWLTYRINHTKNKDVLTDLVSRYTDW